MSYNGDGNETKEGLHRDVVHQPILVVEQRAPLGWYEIVLIVHCEPATFQVYRSTQRYICYRNTISFYVLTQPLALVWNVLINP